MLPGTLKFFIFEQTNFYGCFIFVSPEKKKILPEQVPLSDSEESDSGEMEPRRPITKAPTPSDLGRLVSNLQSSGYSDQLSWLEAYLTDEARDRRMDGAYLTEP